jgi:hypothetical protein
MVRSVRVLFAVGVISVPLALASAAAAQSCPVLDTTCTLDNVTDDTLDDAGGAAGDAVNRAGDTAHDTVQDTVDRVQGRVDDTTSKVRDTIDQVLGKVGDPPPLPGDGGDPGPGGGSGGGGNGGGSQGGGHDGGTSGGGHVSGTGSLSGGGSILSGSAGGSAAAGAADPGSLTVPPTDLSHATARGSSPTIGQVAAGVIGGLAVMALLLGAVAVFLTVQDRVDRRDPKLVPVPIGSDRVQFT